MGAMLNGSQMSETLRISICDPNESSRDDLKKYLVGMDNVWLEADCSRYEFFVEIVEQTTPDLAVIDLDADEPKALGLIETIHAKFPQTGIIAVSSRSDGQLILSAMRAGAREYLNSPIQIEELMGALDRVASTSADGSRRQKKSGSIISVAGVSGGVGTTSVAVNIACALGRGANNSVVLVDLDLSLGDADVFLDMIPEYTLLDVTQNISRLDLALMRKSLTEHESGIFLLPRPIQLQDSHSIETEDLKKVIGLLRASFTHIVFDLSKSYNHLDIAALKMSDHILMLTQLDLPCLRNVVRLFSSLEAYEGVHEKIKIVVNRVVSDKSQINEKKAEETIGQEIFWQIPNNYPVISECRNNGIPLHVHSPKAAITNSIAELARQLDGEPDEEGAGAEAAKKSGWLKFLSK